MRRTATEPANPTAEHLDPCEAADFLRVAEITLRRWRCERRGPPYIKGEGRKGRITYLRSDLVGWMESRRVVPGKVTT